MALTELQFAIINAMMDDYEDVEQVYLGVNRDALEATHQPRYRLVNVVDEMLRLWEEGFIRAHAPSNQGAAPLNQIDHARIHDYWFAPTEKGEGEWKSHQR